MVLIFFRLVLSFNLSLCLAVSLPLFIFPSRFSLFFQSHCLSISPSAPIFIPIRCLSPFD